MTDDRTYEQRVKAAYEMLPDNVSAHFWVERILAAAGLPEALERAGHWCDRAIDVTMRCEKAEWQRDRALETARWYEEKSGVSGTLIQMKRERDEAKRELRDARGQAELFRGAIEKAKRERDEALKRAEAQWHAGYIEGEKSTARFLAEQPDA